MVSLFLLTFFFWNTAFTPFEWTGRKHGHGLREAINKVTDKAFASLHGKHT